MGIETALLGASLGLSIFGASQSKRDAKRAQAERTAFDARSAKLESKAILEEAELEAIEIRREGKLLGKKQTALTAKAGLKLGRGTAAAIQEETRRLTAKDVATTLEAAERKSEQLLTTFGASESEVVSGAEFKEFTKFKQTRQRLGAEGVSGAEAEATALESVSAPANNNFIKSKKPKQSILTGL